MMVILSSLLIVSAIAGGAAENATENITQPTDFVLKGDAEAGAPLFRKKCAVCHGENGDGNGRIKLNPPVADLRDPEGAGKRTDWELYLVIRDGGEALGQSPKMLPWGKTLSDQEIRDLAAFVRSLHSAVDLQTPKRYGRSPQKPKT